MSAPNDTAVSGLESQHGMNSTSSPTRYQVANGAANGNTAYDEERLEWDSGFRWSRWPKKYLRIPRLRRVAVCLLLIDLMIVGLVVRTFEPLITLLRKNEELFGARLTLPLIDPPAPGHSEQNKIPRILHQTSATDVIPEKWVELQRSCKEVYSEYEYKLWTDEVARDFLSAEYPWFVDTWDNYAFPIMRADAIRYFVLYHYGGIYLDLDTLCNRTLPLQQIEADPAPHHAIFKSTKPTGVSNDLMVSSLHHPLFRAAISKLLHFNDITRIWARLQPYCAIMIAAGPFFITMAIKNYLLEQPSLPPLTVQVINATELAPYITDYESCSWHHKDAQALMYIGDHPWIWYTLGAIGLAIGIHLINRLLLLAFRDLDKPSTSTDNLKVAKLT